MIEIKNVTKQYGNNIAVDDISFEVKDNEIVGFLGPNGAGKSTTMNMITGYIDTTKGKIIVNGYDIEKESKKAKAQIGYMPEGTPLYLNMRVKEFINYMAELKGVKRKERKDEVDRVIKETGLKNVESKLIKHVSRGYKQRVSLAGALVGNPEVLILDEPTVGLDPKQVAEIRKLIKELGKKHTVILSSHILSEVSQICERVIIINQGKIVAVDTPKNLEKITKSKNLESAFISLIDEKNDEIEKEEKAKKVAKEKHEKQLEKMTRKDRKAAIKEDKLKAKKEFEEKIDKELALENKLNKEEKERKKKVKEDKEKSKNKESKKTTKKSTSTTKKTTTKKTTVAKKTTTKKGGNK